jgi:hypothetical protein
MELKTNMPQIFKFITFFIGIFFRNPYFHLAEPRDSVEHHFGSLS